jgi:hypothetical protein
MVRDDWVLMTRITSPTLPSCSAWPWAVSVMAPVCSTMVTVSPRRTASGASTSASATGWFGDSARRATKPTSRSGSRMTFADRRSASISIQAMSAGPIGSPRLTARTSTGAITTECSRPLTRMLAACAVPGATSITMVKRRLRGS